MNIRHLHQAWVFVLTLGFSLIVNADHPTYLVGFAQDTLGNDWRIAQVREVEQALAEHQDIHFIYTDAQAQTALQAKHIQDLADIPVDVLIVSPRDQIVLAPVIAEVYQLGIPVILLSRGIESDQYTSYIRPDNYLIGRAAGSYLAEHMPNSGSILMLKGLPEASPTIQRSMGFMDVIQQHSQLNIITRVGNFLRSDTLLEMEQLLRDGIHFDAVYAQSDSMASAVRMALKAHGRDPADIMILGIDYISEARDAIRNGEQTLSFTYPTAGREGAEVAVQIIRGESVEKEIVLPSVKVSAENVNEVEPIF